MKRLALILLAMLPAGAFGAETTVKGHIVDVMCAKRRSSPAGAASHSIVCLRATVCQSSGYFIVTDDNRLIKFDEDGNEKARKFLIGVSKEADIKVSVSGIVDGDKMSVTKIELE
jgi:hypothetical protein